MILLKVNGAEHRTEAGARTLLEVLRDEFGLVGAKEGCGIGMCGACTVLVDGKPISSCLMLVGQAAGREILTIESLGRGGQLHAVQQAFIDHGAFQCAYCTPGFVLSSVALLAENPSPSQGEIREYLAGNLCRCGSYPNILAAIEDLSQAASDASPSERR